MSKTKGNTVDPFNLFDKYGADATRWYLLHVSPAWAPTKFDEDGNLLDEAYEKRVTGFLDELVWMAKTLRYGRNNFSSKYHQ